MKQNSIYSLLGLATKAGKVVSGEFATDKCVKEGKAKVVLVPQDASNNTKKMFFNMCEFYKVPFYVFGDKDELGHAIGKEMRSSVAITDEGFAKSLISKLKDLDSYSTEANEWQK